MTTDTTVAEERLYGGRFTESEGYEAARAAALRVIGSADVRPSTVTALTHAIHAILWWGTTAGELRRIVEAHR